MVEQNTAPEQDAEVDKPQPDEMKIQCFVSKKMVPISQTVEVEYSPGRRVPVLPRYVHYDLEG